VQESCEKPNLLIHWDSNEQIFHQVISNIQGLNKDMLYLDKSGASLDDVSIKDSMSLKQLKNLGFVSAT